MKIVIAGYGIEGKSNYEYFSRHNDVTIADERQLSIMDLPYGVSAILGGGAFGALNGFDMVIRTASLNPARIKTDGKVWSATNEFFAKCPAPIIGVTGSKGKGTTSSLIAGILRAAGHTVHLVGNIGIASLDVLPDVKPNDIVGYEMSSFQLWDLERSPEVGVVLYIEPEHLDVHADMTEYVGAKAHIAMHQSAGDILVYNQSNEYATHIAHTSAGAKIPFQNSKTVHVSGGSFWFGDTQLCRTDSLRLPGDHNLDNAAAAITAAWKWVKDPEVIARGLSSFEGLPHRLKFVREVDGVKYYDDSIATTPGSAIAAIHSFKEPKILIVGGSSKGADFTELAQVVSSNNVNKVIVIGDEAPVIIKAMKKSKVPLIDLGSSTTMSEIVSVAADNAQPGDVVILSPSCASFGMFKNYADRGDQFIESVRSLAANK